ncbi:MAG: esterase/lipase family protein [Bacillota bacterium]
MRQRLRLIMASLLMLLLAASPVAAPAAAPSSPPGPVQPAGFPGSWYLGATPPNLDPTKPVLVFVHGKGGSAATWWAETVYHGTNDMYAYAYNNGYQTAFVDLEPEGDMWVNGELLQQQLAEITTHVGVERVVIIAHSKGGVDANAAAAFFGAGPMIEKVITLGSPHWGTPIADLAYSTWTWWLAALLGQRTDATYVVQTGYMAWFRSVADGTSDGVAYYTLGGRKCGPFLTALWWGCMYLDGEDDGVVPMDFSHKPRATVVADGWWDHDEIRMGSRVWGPIQQVLQSSTSGQQFSPSLAGGLTAGGGLTNMLARGGEVTGTAGGEPFPVESGVRGLTLIFYASSPDFVATLTGPDGSSYAVTMQSQVSGGEIFAGAWMGSVEIAKPVAGEWRFSAAAAQRTGYLMVAALDSDLRARLDVGSGTSAPGGKRGLSVAFDQAVRSAIVTGALSVAGRQPYAQPRFSLAPGGFHRATISLPKQEGVHNLTVTATGSLPDGSAFERTLIASFPVVPKGTQGPWLGR